MYSTSSSIGRAPVWRAGCLRFKSAGVGHSMKKRDIHLLQNQVLAKGMLTLWITFRSDLRCDRLFNEAKGGTMRKRYKKKKHSCALCKPWKMRGMVRWKNKELALLKEFEKLRHEHSTLSCPWYLMDAKKKRICSKDIFSWAWYWFTSASAPNVWWRKVVYRALWTNWS